MVASAIALLALVVGLWFLNNTRPGLRFKCDVRSDVGACLIVGLSELADQDPAEPSTIDPEVAEQQRRLEEEQQAQQAADRAVAQAATNLALAVDTLRFAADDASAAAAAHKLGHPRTRQLRRTPILKGSGQRSPEPSLHMRPL